MKLKVKFSAEYETTIDVDSSDDIVDALSEVSIPENEESKYVDMSYEVIGVYDDCGNYVEH